MNIDKQIDKVNSRMAELQEKLDKLTRQKNREFARAGKAKQRVLIAKDVIAWLALGKLTARSGVYLAIPEAEGNKLGEQCTACALGSAFACIASRTDTTLDGLEENIYACKDIYSEGREFYSDGKMREVLGKYFEPEQMDLIETAFERDYFQASSHRYDADFTEQLDAAINWRPGLKNPKKRLAAIMQNIIDNDGTFVIDVE